MAARAPSVGLWIGLAALVGCTPVRGGWDSETLARSHPGWSELKGQRLGDATPYIRVELPVGEETDGPAELVMFLCRWSTDEPVSISLPSEAEPRERDLLRLALEAWEGVGLGVRFRETASDDAQIRIEFVDRSPERDPEVARAPTALTGVNCRADPGGSLVAAQVALERSGRDMLGRAIPFSDGEFVGAALHELGHALGFQGHVAVGGSIMVREVDQVKRIGASVVAGKRLRAPSVEALYRLPSGVEVGRLPLSSRDADWARWAEGRAALHRWTGPFTRVGERSALLFWRDAEGRKLALGVVDWAAARRDPEALRFVPNRAARELLQSRT